MSARLTDSWEYRKAYLAYRTALARHRKRQVFSFRREPFVAVANRARLLFGKSPNESVQVSVVDHQPR